MVEVYENKEEMNAHGCQANGTGVGGMEGFSQAERYMVMTWSILKSLLFLNHLVHSVCPVYRMVLVMLSTILMKGKVQLPLDSIYACALPLLCSNRRDDCFISCMVSIWLRYSYLSWLCLIYFQLISLYCKISSPSYPFSICRF